MQNYNFIRKSEVIKIHDSLIERHNKGNLGILNENMLDSALSMPEISFGGVFVHPTVIEQAVAYLFHISKNHAFVDGNKRTAFAVMVNFLNLNGYILEMQRDKAIDMVQKTVVNELSKEDLYPIIRKHVKKIN